MGRVDRGCFVQGKKRAFKALIDELTHAADAPLTAWKSVHDLILVLGRRGESGAAKIVATLGGRAETAGKLFYRFYDVRDRSGRQTRCKITLSSQAARKPRTKPVPACGTGRLGRHAPESSARNASIESSLRGGRAGLALPVRRRILGAPLACPLSSTSTGLLDPSTGTRRATGPTVPGPQPRSINGSRSPPAGVHRAHPRWPGVGLRCVMAEAGVRTETRLRPRGRAVDRGGRVGRRESLGTCVCPRPVPRGTVGRPGLAGAMSLGFVS